MDIHIVRTNANNDDFAKLTNLLDREFYEMFGDVVKQYEEDVICVCMKKKLV